MNAGILSPQTSGRPGILSPPLVHPEDAHLLSPTSPSPSVASPITNSNKPWVLVVDDAAINRKILLKMLGADYQIDQAENGLQAVNLVDANPTKYAVVLMDLMMPGRDAPMKRGFEVFEV